ncbi:MAG: hypothetical protein JNL58_14690 [Planctomyces sp.]|nr:hypothetical protein [Planctomyces sp.]
MTTSKARTQNMRHDLGPPNDQFLVTECTGGDSGRSFLRQKRVERKHRCAGDETEPKSRRKTLNITFKYITLALK